MPPGTPDAVMAQMGTGKKKKIVAHLVKGFPTFYATRRFIVVLTKSRHWSYYEAFKFSSRSHNLHRLIILILSSHLNLGLRGNSRSDIQTKILYTFYIYLL
jgi:hypothetical protein